MSLPARKADAAMSKRGTSSNYSVTWRRAKYVGIETPHGSLQTFGKQQGAQRTAKMRVKELLLSSFMASVTCLCREHRD